MHCQPNPVRQYLYIIILHIRDVDERRLLSHIDEDLKQQLHIRDVDECRLSIA